MRGRLRVDGEQGEQPTWREVPDEYWSTFLGEGQKRPVTSELKLPPDAEIPQYHEDSGYFSIKVHHGGEFDEKIERYVGGEVSYFDMCSNKKWGLSDMASMLTEIGLVLGEFCLWFAIPDLELSSGLLPLVTDDEVGTIVNFLCYSQMLNLYTTDSTDIYVGGDFDEFSMTQFEEDERINRIEEIREEREYNGNGEEDGDSEPEGENEGEAQQKVDEDKLTWNGGSKFLVTMTDGGHQIVCDLEKQTCACRKWQLTGIPCFHACSCIFFKHENPLDYMHQCHQKAWYLRVYGHVIEPLNGEEFWEETHETPIFPPKPRVAPGRPKKKRDKKNDIVQTRANNPTMLKRTGTSLRCTWCKEWGHNSRTCQTKKNDDAKNQVENQEVSKQGGKRVVKCTNCQEMGHNKRGCKSQAKEPTSKNMEQSVPADQRASTDIVISVIPQAQEQAGGSSHGGIIQPFKPPAQKNSKKCLGVEPIPGQKYTSLKNLEAAKLKAQKDMGKSKK